MPVLFRFLLCYVVSKIPPYTLPWYNGPIQHSYHLKQFRVMMVFDLLGTLSQMGDMTRGSWHELVRNNEYRPQT